jgi:hypothetical protein
MVLFGTHILAYNISNGVIGRIGGTIEKTTQAQNTSNLHRQLLARPESTMSRSLTITYRKILIILENTGAC